MSLESKKYLELNEFIRNRMSMSHIYQPVMLMELLKSGGEASVRDISRAILAHDPSQIEYYEKITKNMVGNVLTQKNGITEKIKVGQSIKGFRVPSFDELSKPEIDKLIELCEAALENYVNRRGDKIWSHRRKSTGYLSGSIRYEILKRAKFRCELCGISAEEKALEVDHIIPRNKGGNDSIENLQALCYSCNAMKSDRDDTDFRSIAESYKLRMEGCPFCEVETEDIIASDNLCIAIRDGFPVTNLHTLIIPKRHISDYFKLYQPEINSIHSLLEQVKDEITGSDDSVTGFNIGINSGEDAGQTVFHCHVHLIPRRKGDTEDPRGGVRGVIPEKRIY